MSTVIVPTPNSYPKNPQGFTQVPPIGPTNREIYVNELGTADGLGTQASPMSLTKALSIFKGGDHLLLCRGDLYEGLIDNIPSGPSFEFPTLVGTWGPNLERPIVQNSGGGGKILGFDGRKRIDNIVIQGLKMTYLARNYTVPNFNPSKLPTIDTPYSPGCRILGPSNTGLSASNILIEDCIMEFAQTGFEVYDVEGFTFRRNMVHNCYGIVGGTDGKYHGLLVARCKGILVEENVFHINGRAEHQGLNQLFSSTLGTIYSHNVYIHESNLSPAVFRRNFSSSPGSHGAQLRTGGILEENIFFNCPCAAFVATNDSLVHSNLVVGGLDITPQLPRGWGFEFIEVPNLVVSQNIVCNKKTGVGPGSPYTFTYKLEGPLSVSFTRNISSGWNPDNISGSTLLHEASTLFTLRPEVVISTPDLAQTLHYMLCRPVFSWEPGDTTVTYIDQIKLGTSSSPPPQLSQPSQNDKDIAQLKDDVLKIKTKLGIK